MTTLAETIINWKRTAPAAKAADLTALEQSKYDETYQRVLSETGDELKAKLAAQGALNRIRAGMVVKAEVSASGAATVSGWGILYGDAYLKDHHDEYFPRDAEFYLDYYAGAPLWFEHSTDRRYRSTPIGRRVSYEKFTHGIWFVHELFSDHPAYQATLQMLRNGELSYSSDSVPHVVADGQTSDGGLRVWPLVGFSLVRRPAEPGLGTVIVSAP